MTAQYHGISYPEEFMNEESQKVWRKKHCKKGEHLFDEYLSPAAGIHALCCDACGLMVHIKEIELPKK